MTCLWTQFLTRRAARRASRWALSALLLANCSCSVGGRQSAKTTHDPFLESETAPQVAAGPSDPAGRRARRAAPSAGAIRQAGFEAAAASGMQPPDQAIVRANDECRLPEFGNGTVIGDESPAAAAKLYPDEYLFDGGDRDLPIHFSESQMSGLDTEDAAIEYYDDFGKRHVKPTNRVAIYAPRFAAVTTISEPTEDIGSGRPAQSIAAQIGLGMAKREGTFAQHQRDMTERLVSRSRGSGLTSRIASDGLDQPVNPEGNVHTTTPLQDFGFLQTGQLRQADEARLAASIQSASNWTRDQNPVIAAASQQGNELRSHFRDQELVGRENRFNGKARLRIVKLADKAIAEPGDVVTFTIRFDNIGDREVHDVVIVDNLTPRLEYIEDSATCDAQGVLETEDNGEGSLILRWVLDEPLAGRSGGVVTFQARVR